MRLPRPIKRGARFLVTLLFCGALFVAAFGVALLLQANDRMPAFLSDWLPQNEKEPTAQTEGKDEAPEEKTQEPKEMEEVPPTPTEENLEKFPSGAILVRRMDLFGQGERLQNASIYAVDPIGLAAPAPEAISPRAPLVLILCTHSSECYAKEDWVTSPIGDAIYSNDPEDGVIAVANALSKALERAGIPTLFCNIKFDSPTLRSSYSRAAASIAACLEEYPSIRYVIDLHRDGILSEDGSLVACSVEYEGVSYAQILPVVGSDGDGSDAYPWNENLALALDLQERLNSLCPHLCRSVSLRNSPYNQNIAPHSLLLEVGAAGNSLEEALRSTELLSKAIAAYLKGK